MRIQTLLMMKCIIAIVCLAVAGFCLYGFLATFEPGAANALSFRFGYAVIGIGCLLGVARQFFAGDGSS